MAETIKGRLKRVQDRIAETALACGRDPKTVKVVAVSKTVAVDRVLAAIRAGVTDLGENYVQEAREKNEALGRQTVSWHFIGHLQSNKAKYVVKLFDLIHSVDSFKLAKELDKRARAIGKVQEVLVQVNISGEATKSGIETEQAVALVRQMAPLDNLAICGLMTMPPFFDDPEGARPFFEELTGLKERIGQNPTPNADLTELSMGMTGDFEVAIAAGATLVRIGTAIFGERLNR